MSKLRRGMHKQQGAQRIGRAEVKFYPFDADDHVGKSSMSHTELRSDGLPLLDRAMLKEASPMFFKKLAIAYLYHVCRWTVEQIGLAFDHPKGHISRLLKSSEDNIRGLFPELVPSDLEPVE